MIVPIGHDKAVFGRPWFTIGVIGLCTLIQLLRTLLHYAGLTGAVGELHPNDPITWLAYYPEQLLSAGVLTSQFVHAGYVHLAGNMVFLWLTGASIEYRWGPRVWAAVYLTGGVVATLAYGMLHPGSSIPLVGASGAVAVAMGAFLVSEYRARIKFWYFFLIFFRIRMGTFVTPAYVALPLWFGVQVLMSVFECEGNGGVAYSAHVAGFTFGAAVAVLGRVSGLETRLRERIGSIDFDDEMALISDGTYVPPLATEGPYQNAPRFALTSDAPRPPVAESSGPPAHGIEPEFDKPKAATMTRERFDEMIQWLDADAMMVEGSKYIEHIARTSADEPQQLCSLAERVLVAFERPIPLDARALAITARFAVREQPQLCMQATRALMTQYPRSSFTADTMLLAAEVQQRSAAYDKAKKTWQNILQAYPDSSAAITARAALASIP